MLKLIYRQVRRLLTYFKSVRRELAFGLLGISVNRLLVTWMIADLMGNGVAAFQQKSMPALWYAVVSVLPLFVLTMVIQAVSVWFTGKATAVGTVTMRGAIIDAMLSSPLKSMTKSHSGLKLSYFTNDVSAATSSLISALSRPLNAVVVGIGSMIYVVSVHWSLALVTLAVGIATYLYSIYFAKKLHGIALKVQKYLADMEILIKDLLDGIVTARMYHMEEKLMDRAGNVAESLRKEGTRWAWVSGILGGINNTSDFIGGRIVLFVAGLFVLGGQIGAPALMRVSQMAVGAIGVFHLSRVLIDIQKSLAGAERIFQFLDGCEKESGGAEVCAKDVNPVIRIDNISFGYVPAMPVIKDFSMTVNKGEFVAITGLSGSGKSTILRLIQGLYSPDCGYVETLGVNVAEWDPAFLREQIALVPQDPVLFPGTIADNIVIGMEGVDDAMLVRSAMAAGIHDFITELPDGYKTQVLERGDSLSGGQRQRIALARALYRNTSILLLDEATSAMDTVSEAHVHKTLCALAGEKTILFVTHRASVAAMADRIVNVSEIR